LDIFGPDNGDRRRVTGEADKNDFGGLETTMAQAARNAIFYARLVCKNQGYLLLNLT